MAQKYSTDQRIIANYPTKDKDIIGRINYSNKSSVSEYENPLDHFPDKSLLGYGFVYLIRRTGDGIFKIGSTKELKTRLSRIPCACGSPISLYGFLECENHRKEEFRLHSWFASDRIIGEWFNFGKYQVEQIFRFFELYSGNNATGYFIADIDTTREFRTER